MSTAIATIPPTTGPLVLVVAVLLLLLLLWAEARAEDRLETAVLVVAVVGWFELVLLDEAEEERNRYRVLSSVVAPVI